MKILLLGGTSLLADIAIMLVKMPSMNHLHVVLSPRHAKELTPDGKTFVDSLTDMLACEAAHCSYDIIIASSIDDNIFSERASSSNLTLSISAAWIYKQRHIALAGKIYQLHNTLLPAYRGGASFSWMILSGQRFAATNLFLVDEGIDTGKIVLSRPYLFPPECTKPKHFMDYSAKMSIEHLSEFLRIVVENGDSDFLSEPRTQPEELSSYYPRLRSEVNGCINWGWTVSQIERFIRAFDDPYAGAFCRLTGRAEKVILKDVSIVPSAFESFHPYQSGLIIRIDNNQLYVACNGGLLSVARVTSSDNNGDLGIIRPGDRFYSLSTDLDDSVSSRQFYSPS